MASYPTSIASFPTHSDNTDTIFAADVNNPNAEIVAVETGLLNGFQHNISPLTDNNKDLGDSSHRWKNLWVKGTTQFNGVTWTWPSSAGTANQFLSTDGVGVLSFATPATFVQQFRLTLTTATPVTSADVTAATTLYFSPYTGRRCTVFDGSGNPTTLTSPEISIAVPATVSQMYDVFVYNNSGTLTLELLAWTNDTTRATAIVLTGALDAAGIYTKSGDTTRRYVGSFRTTTVSGQTEDSKAKRYVWNYYNRIERFMYAFESTSTWTYSTQTWRQANAAATNQLDLVVGVAEVLIDAQVVGLWNNNASVVNAYVAIGEDSTSSPVAGQLMAVGQCGVNTAFTTSMGILQKYVPVGRHTYVWLEQGGSANTTTWAGNNGGSLVQAGISGRVFG